jgi:hypothetical protein
MKRKIITLLTALALLVGVISLPAQAATEEDIELSITMGLEWLAEQQEPGGMWSSGYAPIAHTGLILVKMCDRAYETGYDPFDPAYAYSGNVIDGLDYLFNMATASTVGTCFAQGTNYENYSTGIAMMAIAATRMPDAVVPVGPYSAQTYKDVLQGCVDYMAWSQCDAPAAQQGGWHYQPNAGWADQSNTGYSVLGLRYAEANLYGFNCNIPQVVKDEHILWVNYIQNPDGGSDYDGTWGNSNLLRTGNLLFEQAFVGIAVDDPRVQAAIGYIQNNWNPTPDSQTMYCLMKGLESYGIDTLDVGGPIDWYDVLADHIIATQNPDGHWDLGWGSILDTVFCLLTLERFVPPPPPTEVSLDVHPTSCPNPFNVYGKGVIPVAILGTEEFDVSQIDPASLRLEGVAPLRWAMEDVATPYGEEFSDPPECMECTEEGPDGYMDLTVKFSMQEIAAAIDGVEDGDCIAMTITGNLKEEFDSLEIIGIDVVRIIKKK